MGKIRIALLFFFMMSITACGARKPPEPNRSLQLHTGGVMFKSSNGFVFALLDDITVDMLRVDIRYPVGSKDDPIGKEGLAHFVEHLAFEFDVQRKGQLSSGTAVLNEFSVSHNAYTARDYTHYYAVAPPENLAEILRYEAERAAMDCKAIRPEIFEREKEVVLNELRQRQGTYTGLLQKMRASMYPKEHPYSRTSTVESVQSIDMEDVCAFIDGPFKNGKVTVVISGGFTTESAKKAAAEAFGRVPVRNAADNPAPQPLLKAQADVEISYSISEPEILFVWPLPQEGSKEYRWIDRMRPKIESWFDGYANEYEWGHSATSYVRGGGYAPLLVLSVSLNSPDKVGDAREALGKVLKMVYRDIKEEGEEKDSYWWQMNLVRHQSYILGSYESLSGKADMLSDSLFYENDSSPLVHRLEETDDSSPAEVRSLMEKWIRADKAQVVTLLKGDEQVGASISKGKTISLHDSAHKIPVDPNDADKPYPLASAPILHMPVVRITSKSGIRVMMWPEGNLPLIRGMLLVDSGSADDPKGQEGLATMSGMGNVNADSMSIVRQRVSTFVDDLAKQLTMELRSPGQAIENKERRQMKQQLSLKRVARANAFESRLRQAVFGANHPYGRNEISVDSVDSLTTDRARGWARKMIVPKNSHLLVAGQFEPKEFMNWVEFFTDQTSSGSKSKPIAPAKGAQKAEWIAGYAGEELPTVEVDIRFRGNSGIDSSFAARQVLAEIISGQLDHLRTEKAVSYGMSCTYTPREGSGYWRISGEVDAGRAAEAGRAIRDALEKLRNGSANYRGDFVFARSKEVEAMLVTATNSSWILSRLALMARFDLSDDFFERYLRRTAALSLAEVEGLVQQELQASQQVFGAYGSKAATDALLQAAKPDGM